MALLERGRHPRFAIGESTTPITNLVLEELADRWDLPRLRPFSKWGTWRAAYPEVACGLKRGFTFFRHDLDRALRRHAAHARQLLVAASPNDAISDTHWYRPDFDHWLVREAEREGVRYVDELALSQVRFEGPGVVLEGERRDERRRRARRVPHRRERAARLPGQGARPGRGRRRAGCRARRALYGHFAGVERWDALHAADGTPPYPIDDAAVHHVFPGGWIWILRFANGVTSAGAAVTDRARRRAAPEPRAARPGRGSWSGCRRCASSSRAPSRRSRSIDSPRLAFRVTQVVGPNWALLPSAAGVIDPLLSTGFALTLLVFTTSAWRACSAEPGLGPACSRPTPGLARPSPACRLSGLVDYERQTQAELDATEQLVAGALRDRWPTSSCSSG